MKKIILNLIAVFFISIMAFAKTNEINLNTEFEIVTKTKSQLNEDDFWFCYEIRRETSYNMMLQQEVTTITYRCTWYTL